jgi:stage V sporulation protein SpoVS
MSEELKKLGLMKHGRVVGNYEFYNIGATTINQLVKRTALAIARG